MKKLFVAAIAACAFLASCTQLDDLTAKTDKLTSDVEAIKVQITDLQKLMQTNFEKYDKAIADLTKKAKNVDDSIAKIQEVIGDIVTEVEDVQSDVEELQTIVSALEERKVVTDFKYDAHDGKYVVVFSDKTETRFHLDSFFKSVVYDGEYVVITFIDEYTAYLKMATTLLEDVELLYVPEFSDGCATLFYYDENDVSPMRLVVSLACTEKKLEAITAGIADGSYALSIGVMTSALTRSVAQGITIDVLPADVTIKENELIIRNIPVQLESSLLYVILTETATAASIHTQYIPVKSTCTKLTYAGQDYHTAKMLDGRWWMTENLRYIPEGKTPASKLTDLSQGMWYPVDVVNNVLTENPDTVKKQGYLYSPAVAFGTSLNLNNYDKLEGVQGICPDGWHIPTGDEIFALLGVVTSYPGSPTAKAPCAVSSVYYNGNATTYGHCPAANLNLDGFNWFNCGYVKVTVDATTGAAKSAATLVTLGYGLSSTAKAGSGAGDETKLTKGQYFCIGYNKNTGNADGMLLTNYACGASVRCIKNK